MLTNSARPGSTDNRALGKDPPSSLALKIGASDLGSQSFVMILPSSKWELERRLLLNVLKIAQVPPELLSIVLQLYHSSEQYGYCS